MEKRIDKLIEIAQNVGLHSESAQLQVIKARFNSSNCELILPLVGEFSSGKTTLLNAISDSKKLETAVKPTTATLFELHFGCERCFAQVYEEDGKVYDVDDIGLLKNEELSNAHSVVVYDTSKNISQGIVLVDTPGLSSSDIRHKQVLIDFLPQADGIILVVDVNQQITKSLIDFVKTMELAKRPIFLVITKCDTKAASEIEAAKTYIAENVQIPLKQVICVSAVNNDVQPLYTLLSSIQTEKGQILEQVNAQRISKIAEKMLVHIEEMLAVSETDSDLEEKIRLKELELKKFKNNIDIVISSVQGEIADIETQTIRKFEDKIFQALDVIVAQNNGNLNTEAIAAINNTASILLNDYKMQIHSLLNGKIQESNNAKGISLECLGNIEFQSLQMPNLNFNLDLDSIGHKYDKAISGAVKVAAAVAVVATAGAAISAAGGATAGSAAASGATTAAAGTAQTAATTGTLISVADTATDIGSMVYISGKLSKIRRYAGQTKEQLDKIESNNQQVGRQLGSDKGFVESIVGFVTDKAMGKPQRHRAIHNYLDSSLIPDFSVAMRANSTALVAEIGASLKADAQISFDEISTAIRQLHQQYTEKQIEFQQRMNQLKEYKTIILAK